MLAMNEFAENFFRYDYTETKDLLKSFITLSSGTLVLSVTFSEKIVDYQQAPRHARIVVLVAWLSIATSIVLAGLSLTLIAAAAGKALYGGIPFLDFMSVYELSMASWTLIIAAGVSYICGLFLIIAAAAIRVFDRNSGGT